MSIRDPAVWAHVEYRLLGSFEVLVDDRPVNCGGLKQRSVLAMLLLEPNRPVTIGRLTEGLWGDQPPDRALATLQVYISSLRKVLPSVDGTSPIETRPNGYLLQADDSHIDVKRFTNALDAAREADRFRDHQLVLQQVDAALAEWQGHPLADFEELPFALGPATSLTQQYQGAVEQRIETRLQLGEHRAVIPELESALVTEPLRESLWRLLMLALYRSGRQADALTAFRRCSDALLDQLGIDPSPETRELELAVLQQDPSLEQRAMNQPVQRGLLTVPAEPVPAFTLKVEGSEQRTLAADISIGRSDDCDIVIDEPLVSRRHAEIRRGPNGWILSDLSMNGTIVNGALCTRRIIADGDVIMIGSRPITVALLHPRD